MKTLRDAWIVALFDLGESLRSRKVLVFLALYVVGAIAATYIFTEILQSIETELASKLLVARTDRPGSLTTAVMESPELRRVLAKLVGDRDLAAQLISIPPIALLYGWVAMAFGPIFVVLTSSDTVSTELATGSARFALVRTDRSSWALGKLLGQATLLGVGVLLGGVAAWLTGYVRMGSFPGIATAAWTLRYAASAFVYAYAYLGLALGVSQLTRSVPWSRGLGLFALIGVVVASALLRHDEFREASPVLFDSLALLFPSTHKLDLWRTGADIVPAVVMLFALGTVYFTLGHLRFARRDA